MFAGSPPGRTAGSRITLDDLAREGARRMIAAALEAEVEEYVASFVDEVDEDGKRLVVRNGRARERRLTIGSGTVPIRAPRVNDKRILPLLPMVRGRGGGRDRGVGPARRRAVARAAVDRAGRPLRRPRVPRRVRRAVLRLSSRAPTAERRHNHGGRFGGDRTDRRRRYPPAARLAGGADR